ncbi:hypothetical protein [Paracraurococcus ruber]|uniref:Lipoprotein n=1 Tax=Paracraurococcus ruber TaxID=77675 RepID=A0ABS1CTB8_9PROT|nr:hypothetical protein [Paracraurococcus ruber]MBK1657609.1 hypothetical protein [Paracraurococcus ruber]TDG32483.1 hypothetical protein E2C05_06885 [Paracraurococcus ruber]
MTGPVVVVGRERRGPVGRAVKGVFLSFQVLMLLGALATCTLVGPFVANADPEVALGAGLFAAQALGTIWLLWPLGTLALGLLLLLTRGRRRVVTLPAPPAGGLT